MLIKQIIDMYDLLDDGRVDGAAVVNFMKAIDPQVDAETYPLVGPRGTTHMVKIRIPGSKGKSSGGDIPTLGILGRLGGLGARPEMIGFVSDGDGALAALAIAAKLLDMRKKGDVLPGDVFISTHICPDAPTQPHDPVPFMGSPVDMYQVNQEEVTPELDAIFSIDTTKGNRVINTRGFAISQPVKEGYILRLPEELLDIMQRTTGVPGEHAGHHPLRQRCPPHQQYYAALHLHQRAGDRRGYHHRDHGPRLRHRVQPL